MTALGVLCCFALFVCLTLLASFFLPSHLSFKNMYIQNLPHQFAVQYKARNNKDVIRDDIITALASLVTRNGDYSHTVDLSNPDLTVVVEIIKVTFNNLIIYTHIYVSGTMHINVIQSVLSKGSSQTHSPGFTQLCRHAYAHWPIYHGNVEKIQLFAIN